MKTKTAQHLGLSRYYIAWFSIALFFFYQYILRISPGIMVVELRSAFQLTAEQFSSLGSIYLLAYALLQIPLGFILDSFGVRRVISIAILICILGACVFALATDLWMLQIGRFLIGLGSAPAFICALKIVHDHLPEEYAGLLMGFTLAIGTIGAVISGKIVVILLESSPWNHVLFFAAALGLVILLFVWFAVPSDKQSSHMRANAFTSVREGLVAVFEHKEIILYSLLAIGLFTPLSVMADLWGTAFLIEKYSLPRAQAAGLTLYLYMGLTLGSLVLPWLSLKYHRAKGVIQICIIGLICTLGLLIYGHGLNLWQLAILITLIGIFCGAEMICFAAATRNCTPAISGLALGVVNTLNMLGGGVVQQMIGWTLDLQWKGGHSMTGERYYGVSELEISFSLLIAIIIACGLLTLKMQSDRR